MDLQDEEKKYRIKATMMLWRKKLYEATWRAVIEPLEASFLEHSLALQPMLNTILVLVKCRH